MCVGQLLGKLQRACEIGGELVNEAGWQSVDLESKETRHNTKSIDLCLSINYRNNNNICDKFDNGNLALIDIIVI